jgi:hypothetical protein
MCTRRLDVRSSTAQVPMGFHLNIQLDPVDNYFWNRRLRWQQLDQRLRQRHSFGRNHNPAPEPNHLGRLDSDVHRCGDRYRAVDLSMAEEWDRHFRRDLGVIHDSPDDFSRQRREVYCGREQCDGFGHEWCRDVNDRIGACFEHRCRHLSLRHHALRREYERDYVDADECELHIIRITRFFHRRWESRRSAALSCQRLGSGRRLEKCSVRGDRARHGLGI